MTRREILTTGLAVSALGGMAQAAVAQTGGGTLSDRLTPARFGARGDGVADDTAALRSAFGAAATSGKPIMLEGGLTYRTGDLRIPAGSLLIVEPGASLMPDRQGAELRIDGYIISQGNGQIFRPGWTFAKTDIQDGFEDVPIEWFGGRSSVSERPDSSAAFRYALRFCAAMRSRTILLGNGNYFVGEPIVITAPVGIRGRGIGSTFLFGSPRGGAPVIDLQGSRALGISYIGFTDFALLASERDTRVGIRSTWFAHVTLARVDFRNFRTALDLADGSYSWKIDDCRFLENTLHVDLGENSNNTWIGACQFLRGKRGIALTGSSNSVTIGHETNFELIDGNPIFWSGAASVIMKLAVVDCRFEACTGFVGSNEASATVVSLSFERNFVADSSNSIASYLKIPKGRNIVIAGCTFESAQVALVDIPPSVEQITIRDNDLVRIPQINAATRSGGIGPADGFVRSRAYNCSGVRGSTDAA